MIRTSAFPLLLALVVGPMAGGGIAHAKSSVEPANLRCEYLSNPIGIDSRAPRLSWQLDAASAKARGQRQTAYQVLVGSKPNLKPGASADFWDSGVVESDACLHIPYSGKPLSSNLRCYWTVRVRDEQNNWSSWSKPAQWTMGLVDPAEWTAKWIGTSQIFSRKKGYPPPDNDVPDPWLRKTFDLPKKPSRAFIHVASVGYHEIYVNGRKIGDAVLAPCTTDHTKRARYVTYDITDALRPGRNALGLWLGVSWSIFPPYKSADRPATPMVIAQGQAILPDGTMVAFATDETWKTHPSPNRLLGVWDFMHFGGELYDATREVPNWAEAGLDDSSWKPVTVYAPKLQLSAQQVEPNRLRQELRPMSIETLSNNVHRIDMGTNFTGWIEIEVRGKPGQRVDFEFSENKKVLMTHRNFSALIIGPSGKSTFKNRFNYSTGRWITVKGLAEAPKPADCRGWLVRTDYASASEFECSQPMLNDMRRLVLWTFENLSLGGYLVDCAQRERMGYGGDAHATTETGMQNFHLGALYTKWSEDWRDVQGKEASWGVGIKAGQVGSGQKVESGNLPYTAPTYWGGGGPGWSGYCVTLPWFMYLHYGDQRALEVNFNTISHWLAFLETKAKDDMLVRYGGEWDFLGDWLWPGAKGVVNGDTQETLFFNNCYWVFNLRTAARIADVLQRTEQAAQWRQRADTVSQAIHRKFYKPSEASYVNGFQAYLSIALVAGVTPPEERARVAARLEREIMEVRKGHIHAGITGGYFVLRALLDLNRTDLIHTMATKEDYPGWGNMLKHGATTAWEDWEGSLSLSHSSYLHGGLLFNEGLNGIRPDPQSPGYKHFLLRPAILTHQGLNWSRASFESPYGTILSDWEVKDGTLKLKASVPPNTTATLSLPASTAARLLEGGKAIEKAKGVDLKGRDSSGCAVIQLQPGRYEFTVEAPH